MNQLERTLRGPAHSCVFCTRADQVLTFAKLEPGDHIRFGEGQFYMNIFKRNVSVFSHHAIVTEVETLSQTTANLTIVSFETSPSNGEILVKEAKRCVNLACETVYVISYCIQACPKYEIIQRARWLVAGTERYSMLWNNCEHLAHYCCTGIRRSNQIYELVFHVKEMAKSGVQHLLELLLKLAKVSLNDIADSATFCRNLIGQGKAVSVFTLVYLLYCVYQHLELYRDLSGNQICPDCCRDRLKYMWIKFIIYCSTQVDSAFIISVVISTGLGGNALLGVKALLFAASAILMWAFPTMRNRLLSPFKGKMIPVKSLKYVNKGDVVSLKNLGKLHDAVVCKVDVGLDTRKGTLTVIHYSSPTLFGRRVIVRDEIEVCLDIDVIKLHDYSGYSVHKPNNVVKRATQRVGETKYGFLSNRSCHFCHWAKVDATDSSGPTSPIINVLEYDRSLDPEESLSPFSAVFVNHRQNRPKVNSNLEKSWAKIRDDVKPGQIVRLKIGGKQHYGVTTGVDYGLTAPSMLSLQLVYRGPDNVLQEGETVVDLNREDVWIFKYHPVYQYTPGEIVKRARQKVGVRKCGRFETSFKLPEEIGRKKTINRIDSFREVRRGDVIVFYYWSVKHAAVVSDVVPTDRDVRTVAYVTVIHYSSDSWLSQRVVKEETIFMDLNKGDVFLKNYDGFTTYQKDEVVNRARRVIGEQKFSIFGNTSWDLAHWAKVVQKPVIATPKSEAKTKVSKDSDKNDEPKKYLLLPEVGETYGHFQRHPVRQWKDLKPGTIVEYKPFMVYCQGILTDASEEMGTMTMIHYKPYSVMPLEVITKETVEVDLKRDYIWTYVCDPTKANKARQIVENAEKRLDDQTARLKRGSWAFCVECALREEFLT